MASVNSALWKTKDNTIYPTSPTIAASPQARMLLSIATKRITQDIRAPIHNAKTIGFAITAAYSVKHGPMSLSIP